MNGADALPDARAVTAHVMSLMQRGFTRLYSRGETIELRSPDDYARPDFKDVYVLVDRLVARPEVRERLVDSFETCFTEGHGTAIIETVEDESRRLRFSERFECKYDGTIYAQPEPRLFSFNNPYGACPTCQGFGNIIGLDAIRHPDRAQHGGGGDQPWTKLSMNGPERMRRSAALKGFAGEPFSELSRQHQRALIEARATGGVRGFFAWLETKKIQAHVRVFLAKYAAIRCVRTAAAGGAAGSARRSV